MLAFLGFIIQHNVTGKGPFENLVHFNSQTQTGTSIDIKRFKNTSASASVTAQQYKAKHTQTNRMILHITAHIILFPLCPGNIFLLETNQHMGFSSMIEETNLDK